METRKHAEAELFKRAEKVKEMFSPLIDRVCNPKCVCFVKASIKESQFDEGYPIYYSVVGGYCGNGMFKQGE